MQPVGPLTIFENKNIRRPQSFFGADKPARPRLILCNAGNGNTLLGIGPLNKTGTVKPIAGRIPTKPVTGANL